MPQGRPFRRAKTRHALDSLRASGWQSLHLTDTRRACFGLGELCGNARLRFGPESNHDVSRGFARDPENPRKASAAGKRLSRRAYCGVRP
jgi:hypothetical protein